MKVLYVNTNEDYGGAARAAMRIMRAVQHRGVETQMLVKDRRTQTEDVVSITRFSADSFVYRVYDWIREKIKNKIQHYRWHPYMHTKQNMYLSDTRSTDMHGALCKMDYDILHLHWINQRFLDIGELNKVHKPIVWTLHDSWAFCGVCHYFGDCEKYQTHCGACSMLGSKREKDLAYEVFEEKMEAYKDLDLHIVTPSKWLGDCARRSALLGRFPVHVIPNCIDTDLFRPLTKDEIGVIADREENAVVRRVFSEANAEKEFAKPMILYGAIQAATDRIKGFASLLSALQLLDRERFKAHLVVFGADTQELPMQFENIDVTFVGYIGEANVLSALYSIADVMVVPSYSEVFGQTASEAMSCGTPVVAFRCTGIQEVVEKGCGYLADLYSAKDLATGIRYCIENNPNNILGKNARKSVETRYAMDIVAKQYEDLYQAIVDNAIRKDGIGCGDRNERHKELPSDRFRINQEATQVETCSIQIILTVYVKDI